MTTIRNEEDIMILKKYDDVEQVSLCKAILNSDNLINVKPELVLYILNKIDYTVPQWRTHYAKITIIAPHRKLIEDHIIHIILYNNSLRNTWILSCITI